MNHKFVKRTSDSLFLKCIVGYRRVVLVLGLACFPYFINIKYGSREKMRKKNNNSSGSCSFPTNERCINNHHTKTTNITILML